MKKFLALALLLGSSALFASEAKAATTVNTASAATVKSSAALWQRNRGRVVTRTRVVRRGRYTYRETVQTRYFPNGRVVTRVIRSTRIR